MFKKFIRSNLKITKAPAKDERMTYQDYVFIIIIIILILLPILIFKF